MKRKLWVFKKIVLLLIISAFSACASLGSVKGGAGETGDEAPYDPGETGVPGGADPIEGADEAGLGVEDPSPGGSAAAGQPSPAAAAGEPAIPGQEEPSGQDAAATAEGTEPSGEEGALAEGGEEAAAEETEEEKKLKAEMKILDMDIKTSSLSELASWCRSLGLSEGGSREDLAARLREHYKIRPMGETKTLTTSKKKTIIIESARSAEYFTIEIVDEEYARLKGNVVVSLKDGDANHRIKAAEILYNRTRNIMSANGGVEYVKEEPSKTETYRGDRITVNLDNWASVFTDAVSERSTGSTSTFRFAGTLITRSDEEATILTNAKVTNGSTELPYWSIDASKLWLLPGSDWAILNGVLKVGEVPVFWIPAFFFPSDEIVFHPVFGFRSREGNFMQTTTYLMGHPVASTTEASSITKMMGNNLDDEKVQHGIFLKSTGKKNPDPNDKRLSLILDSYSNLGAYLGTEFVYPHTGLLRSLDLSAGLGFTRNIYQTSDGTYTPFAPDGTTVASTEWKSEWNTTKLFSMTVPLRYRLRTNGSISGSNGSLSWAFPYYSDPKVDKDFLKRSEEMDWFSMIKQGNNVSEDDEETTDIGAYEWRLAATLNPKIQDLNPYISELTFSSISSTLAFRIREDGSMSASLTPFAPNAIFYYPDKFTLMSVTGSIAGTPFTLGGNSQSFSETPKQEDPLNDLFKNIGIIKPPWETAEESANAQQNMNSMEIKPPSLSTRFNVPIFPGPQLSFDYRLAPSGASEMQFRSSQENWPDQEKVNWNEISSILTSLRSSVNAGFTLQEPSAGVYSVSFRGIGDFAWQDYSMINDEAEEFDSLYERNSLLQQAFNARYFTTSWETTAALKPLFWNTVFSNTTLQYTARGLLAKSVYKPPALLSYTDPIEDPVYDIEKGEWIKEKLESNQFAANIAASIMDYTQNLNLSLEMPPRDMYFNGSATIRAWISETSVSERIFEPFDEEKRLLEPISLSETLRITSVFNAQQTLLYDPELEDFTTLNSSLNLNSPVLGNFRATFSMNRSHTYFLDNTQGWLLNQDEEEALNPRDFQLSYTKNFTRHNILQDILKDRFSFNFNVNTSMIIDLQRYTYSRFLFSLGITLGITKFLDLNLSTSSENAVIFRYLQELPFFGIEEELPGEKDVLKDLANSFSFFDDSKRRSSGFKLKSLNIGLVHHMGDWTAKLGIVLSPYLDQTVSPYQYRFNNEVSFIVQWTPITEAKTEITYDKDILEVK
ncbi:MAG: LPS-assembly protein LptD [Treponema sp.]|jgi:hypothetical protein|nr:LPS-assembly protein LptD [Treponema sp.]